MGGRKKERKNKERKEKKEIGRKINGTQDVRLNLQLSHGEEHPVLAARGYGPQWSPLGGYEVNDASYLGLQKM